MGRADLVVPVRTDKEEVSDVRVGHQMFEEVEGSRVQPLQIIQEESERVLLSAEYADERPEHRIESVLRFLRRNLRHRQLLADYELELGDEIYDKLTVQTHSIPDCVPPTPNLCLVLAQNLPNQSLEGLSESRVRDIPLVLVKLTRNKDAARRNNYFVQLVDYR